MISFIRRALSSWIALGILGLVLIAFIITGVGGPDGPGGGSGGGGTVIAKAGDIKIGSSELLRLVQNQLDGARREQPTLDRKAFLAGGGFEGVTDVVITTHALESWGHDQGFAIGKRLIDAQIATIPTFRGVTGQFDEAAMRAALAQARISERDMRADITTDMMRSQILTPVSADVRPSAKVAQPYASLLLEERRGMVGIIPYALLIDPRQPTDAEIAAAYRANIAAYTRPEARVLRYALFGPAQVAAQAVPSEADIAQYYKENSATYAPRETRTLSQVITPDENLARNIAASARTGRSLAEAAAKAGLEAATLTDQNRSGYARASSDTIAAQVFSAAKGGVVGPAKGAFGWYIVRVDTVTGTPARTLDQARPEISAALAKQKGEEALSDLSGKIEDDIADGSSFAEVVAKNKLVVVETPPLLATGQPIDRLGWQAPPELAALLKTGFDASADERPTVETVANDQRYALLSVAKIIPPAPVPLAQVRGAVTRDFILKRAAKRADTIAKQVTAAVNRGIPLAKALADTGIKLPPPQLARARQIDLAEAQQRGAQIPPPVRALFALQKGKARTTAGEKGDVLFVTALTEVIPGNLATAPGLLERTGQELARSVTAELSEQFMRAVEADVKVERHPDSIAAAKRQFAGEQ